MVIENDDIEYYYSTGSADANVRAGNTNPDQSLGGRIGGLIPDMGALLDKLTGQETRDGDTNYRKVWVKNNHASLTLEEAIVWIRENVPSSTAPGVTAAPGAFMAISIGLDPAAVATIPQTGTPPTGLVIANEATAPAGVSFTAPDTEAAALEIGNMPRQSYKAIWLRRNIEAGSPARDVNELILRVQGDTAQ